MTGVQTCALPISQDHDNALPTIRKSSSLTWHCTKTNLNERKKLRNIALPQISALRRFLPVGLLVPVVIQKKKKTANRIFQRCVGDNTVRVISSHIPYLRKHYLKKRSPTAFGPNSTLSCEREGYIGIYPEVAKTV